jgi:hypothetical protein
VLGEAVVRLVDVGRLALDARAVSKRSVVDRVRTPVRARLMLSRADRSPASVSESGASGTTSRATIPGTAKPESRIDASPAGWMPPAFTAD